MKPTARTDGGDVYIFPDAQELSHGAAQFVIEVAQRSIQQSGRFTFSLSGGSTPKSLYGVLASPEFRNQIPWSKVHLFWGDERCVPPDHAQSNYRMVNESLLSKVPIPPANVHRMPAELPDHEQAAAQYEQVLRDFFNLADNVAPRFDLLLLGLGQEGHTASLFPDSGALAETSRFVVTTYVEKFHSQRLSFTLPIINAAAEVAFLVAGEEKAEIVQQVFKGASVPAAQVRPVNGKLSWFLDRAAARKLPEAS